MLHFIILDDNVEYNKTTVKRLLKIFKDNSMEAEVSLDTALPHEVIEYCSKHKARNNVYLLDVDVRNNINGIEVAEIIREQDARAYIVFVSGHPEYVLPSLKARIFDYLVKPVSAETLGNCIKALYKDYKTAHSESVNFLVVKSGFSNYVLDPKEIVYLEKFGHLLVIHTASGRIESAESLESIMGRLDVKNYFRCHKSYVVNTSYISRIDNAHNLIYLKDGSKCLMSKRGKKELRLKYEGGFENEAK